MRGFRFDIPVTTMKWTRNAVACATALLMSACGVHQSETPALTGPSELALSVSMSASPDSINQDGRSNSTITVAARDANGHGSSGITFRLDMLVDNQLGDYGTLSTRNVTTGSDGRATATYTAPVAPPPGSAIGTCAGSAASGTTVGRCVQISATSIGNDYSTAGTHTVELHLMPTGVIIPPGSIPLPSFVVLPASPAANSPAQFDGSKSCAGTDASGACSQSGTLVSFAWNFGDGATGTGVRGSHTYTKEGSYPVTLTVTNDLGLTATSPATYVTVGAGAAPTPKFIFSPPTSIAVNQPVNFDANTSTAGAGHSIVRFVWNFGDGAPLVDTGSPFATHAFTAIGSYRVTLTVVDESGQSGTSEPQTIAIGSGGASANFSVFPAVIKVNVTEAQFDASASLPSPGQSIVSYQWDFDDSNTTGSGQKPSHKFLNVGTHHVTLKVTDSSGQSALATQDVKVDP
jgi:PKD repeat protein